MNLFSPAHYKTCIITLLFIIASLVIGNVAVSASLSTSGEQIRQLELEKQHLTEANQDIKRSILYDQALINLESKAQDLGFVSPVKVVSIGANSSVAMN